ncbi:MAG: ribonuclease R [Anaerorhabdus sp.]
MELKERIIQLINASPKETCTIEFIAKELNETSTSQFVQLNKALNELEEEFLLIRNQKNCFSTTQQMGIEKGIIKVNKKGFGFVDFDDYSIYVAAMDLGGAMNLDEVAVQITKRQADGIEGKVIQVLTRKSSQCVGVLEYRQGRVVVFLDDARINGEIKITNLKKFKVVSGTKALFKIVKFDTPIELEIVQLIGHKDDPGVDILSVLLSCGIEPTFPKEVMDQAKAISQEIENDQRKGRMDLTNIITVTIDGDDSKDFDDAISIIKEKENFRLWVHIADVSAYVTEGSPMDEEARKRGTSTYVTDRVVPMLPHLLSNGICSLNPHVERLALTCEMVVDPHGEVKTYELYPSVIRSTERMTYNNVNKILEGDEKLMEQYTHLGDLFTLMSDCAKGIRERRVNLGAIDFDKNEAKIIVNKNGEAIDIQLRERKESEKIIEDFMICANEVVAKHMKWLEYPCLYRVHETPAPKKLREFARLSLSLGHKFKGNIENIHPKEIQKCLEEYHQDENIYPVLSTMMLRSMQKARYDQKCLGHFGLASSEYLHFTSPIRRYPDLIVHRMLRKYGFEGCSDLQELKRDEVQMEQLGEETSNCERISTEAEREVDDMKKAEYMENHVGLVEEGIISSINSFGFFVELANTIEGLVHVQNLRDDHYHYDPLNLTLRGERTGKVYRLGEKVMIRCIGANKRNRTVDFEVMKPKKDKIQRWR